MSDFEKDLHGYYIYKDTQATLDYTIDWSNWLGADTIAASVWIIPTGLTAGVASNTPTSATQFISGGTVDQSYIVSNKITTAGGRIEKRSFKIVCIER